MLSPRSTIDRHILRSFRGDATNNLTAYLAKISVKLSVYFGLLIIPSQFDERDLANYQITIPGARFSRNLVCALRKRFHAEPGILLQLFFAFGSFVTI
jgi:hypothetical protein